MKKITYIMILLFWTQNLISGQSHAQTTVSHETFHEKLGNYYLEKSKSEKAAALIFLSSGILLALRGGINVALGKAKNNMGIIIFCLGAGLSLGSIPLFVMSEKSRVRAVFLNQDKNHFNDKELERIQHVPAGLAIFQTQKEKE